MADELAKLRQSIDALPRDVTAALRSVAWQTSRRVKDRARDILNARTGGKADRIAAITIVEDDAENVFRVIAEGPSDKPANLALWFERGTRHMVARPFMRPAADAETEQFRRDMVDAALDVVGELERL
jgi:HK97 gp10 family phage protein